MALMRILQILCELLALLGVTVRCLYKIASTFLMVLRCLKIRVSKSLTPSHFSKVSKSERLLAIKLSALVLLLRIYNSLLRVR